MWETTTLGPSGQAKTMWAMDEQAIPSASLVQDPLCLRVWEPPRARTLLCPSPALPPIPCYPHLSSLGQLQVSGLQPQVAPHTMALAPAPVPKTAPSMAPAPSAEALTRIAASLFNHSPLGYGSYGHGYGYGLYGSYAAAGAPAASSGYGSHGSYGQASRGYGFYSSYGRGSSGYGSNGDGSHGAYGRTTSGAMSAYGPTFAPFLESSLATQAPMQAAPAPAPPPRIPATLGTPVASQAAAMAQLASLAAMVSSDPGGAAIIAPDSDFSSTMEPAPCSCLMVLPTAPCSCRPRLPAMQGFRLHVWPPSVATYRMVASREQSSRCLRTARSHEPT